MIFLTLSHPPGGYHYIPIISFIKMVTLPGQPSDIHRILSIVVSPLSPTFLLKQINAVYNKHYRPFTLTIRISLEEKNPP